MLFLASVSFRGLPARPFKGVGYGNPKSQRRNPWKYSESGGVMLLSASVGFRELPRDSGLPM